MENKQSEELVNLRRRASRFLLLLNWIHIPLIVAATIWSGKTLAPTNIHRFIFGGASYGVVAAGIAARQRRAI